MESLDRSAQDLPAQMMTFESVSGTRCRFSAAAVQGRCAADREAAISTTEASPPLPGRRPGPRPSKGSSSTALRKRSSPTSTTTTPHMIRGNEKGFAPIRSSSRSTTPPVIRTLTTTCDPATAVPPKAAPCRCPTTSSRPTVKAAPSPNGSAATEAATGHSRCPLSRGFTSCVRPHVRRSEGTPEVPAMSASEPGLGDCGEQGTDELFRGIYD
jgi:hypothetical protein